MLAVMRWRTETPGRFSLGHRNFRHTVPYTELAPTRAVPWNFATRVDKKVCGESDEVAAARPMRRHGHRPLAVTSKGHI